MATATKRKASKPKPPPFESVSEMLEGFALKWSWIPVYLNDRNGRKMPSYDDAFDIAQQVYLNLAAEYDGTFEFVSYLKYKVWMAFKSYRRAENRRLAKARLVARYEAVETPYFAVDDFVGGLEEDAAAVVSLVFETPRDLVRLMRQQGGNRGVFYRNRGVTGGGHEASVCLRKYLRDNKGWPRRRIDSAFHEIREALA